MYVSGQFANDENDEGVRGKKAAIVACTWNGRVPRCLVHAGFLEHPGALTRTGVYRYVSLELLSQRRPCQCQVARR